MNKVTKHIFAVVFVCIAVSSHAGFWDFLNPIIKPFKGPKRNVHTLIMTGNYEKPLVISQLIQHQSKQPYLLLPAAGGTGIFFNPPPERTKKVLEIREANLARFIRFLNPKQIIILGKEQYVPTKYLDMIDENIPVIIVKGNDWQRIANRLETLLGILNLGEDYKDITGRLKTGYKPSKTPPMEIEADITGVKAKAEAVEDAPAVDGEASTATDGEDVPAEVDAVANELDAKPETKTEDGPAASPELVND